MKRVKTGADASSGASGVNASSVIIEDNASSVKIEDNASSVIINNSATLGSVASFEGDSQLLFMEKDKFISIKGSKLPHWHQTDKV